MATAPKNPSKSPATAPKANEAPAGYTDQGDDIVGTWDYSDGHPIHFIPKHVKLSDSTIDKRKHSVLVFGELVDACKVHTKDEDGEDETITAEPGDMIGVWYKPGMNRLKNLSGVKVWMVSSGEKDVGKPSPMKTFTIKAESRGSKLRVDEDNRKESKPQAGEMQQQDMAMPKDADGNDLF
jgi:hypothetical protein